MTASPPSKYVKVDVSPARVARVWEGVSSRLDVAPSGRRRWLYRSMAVAALAGIAGVVTVRVIGDRHAHSAWSPAALETASDAMAVALDDGSRLELAAQTKVRVTGNEPLSMALELDRGRVDCDITPRPGRHFSVSAAGVEVRVKGTRFGVELAPSRDRVNVDVTRGLVEVSWANGTEHRDLAAGERWSIDLRRPAAANDEHDAAASADSAEPSASAEPSDSAEPRASGASEAETAPSAAAHASATHAAPATPGARELLDLGNAARRAGDAVAAAHAYEQLLSAHPSDPRAGLAAFELGRLRMDRLGDAQGAISALQKAVMLAPGAGFREDAMARLVEAYAAAGATDRCRSAQSAYLKSYPNGVHSTAVARQCGGN
ncbi:MAG TPA: FecR domain-containing protein [Polyangiaceae bacterium]|nr:FecR domain-containing protein [Polyangiaceae bacterium]